MSIMREKIHFLSLFPRKMVSEKRKKFRMILNQNGGIGKGKKMNDPKSKGKCFHYGVEGH